MAVGNAIGSVTANTGLILALTMIFSPFAINRKDYILRDILLVGSVALLYILCCTGVLNPYLALLMFIPLVVFMWDNIKKAKPQKVEPTQEMKQENKETLENADNEQKSDDAEDSIIKRIIRIVSGFALASIGVVVLVLFKERFTAMYMAQIIVALIILAFGMSITQISAILKLDEKSAFIKKVIESDVVVNLTKLVAGIAGIVIGSNLLVDYGSAFASLLHIPEIIIAVTIVAIGTSLPELITTINSLIKKNSSLSAGNIIGANIIDVCLILPVCAIIGAATGASGLLVSKQSIYLDFSFCLGILVTAAIPPLVTKKFQRWQGIACMALYITYLVLCVLMGQGIIFS